MNRVIQLPPESAPLADGARLGGWWRETEEPGRILCELCPRACVLRPGDRGFCFVRENREGEMVLATYGRSTGFCIDPIEKKPLNQFYPGTSVLSFGTAGCNLGCKFCQNWSISKSREVESLSENASPEAVARAAQHYGCRSVAFTYNDPIVWAEYAIDAAQACHALGIKTVAVTAGYITPTARKPFFEVMDAANVDLKGFSEEFYQKLTLSHLQPVLDTLAWIKRESNCWLEITNLIIPRANDSAAELRRMCDWLLEYVGPDTPLHFSAFHPDFRLRDRPHTPVEMLLEAYEIARSAGLNYVYVGNVAAPPQQTTYCPGCRSPLIERIGYEIRGYRLAGEHCNRCQRKIAGCYDSRPGDWGSRRQPVRISGFEPPPPAKDAQSKANAQTPLSLKKSDPAMLALDCLTTADRLQIGQFAAAALHTAVLGQSLSTPELSPALADQPVLGVFVSAKRRGMLRSCCGFIGQPTPLAQALTYSAQRTANDDRRFPPLAPRELPALDLEIWLLANSQPMLARGEARKDALVIGKHGLTIALGEARGLLLPGVAIEHQLDAAAFLRQVSKKAGLPPTAWMDDSAQLTTFEGLAIPHPPTPPSESTAAMIAHAEPPLLSAEDLHALTDFCHSNVFALLQGATPNYFAFGVSDANVNGVVAAVFDEEGRPLAQAHRLSLLESLPLQSTLFGIAESLAGVLQRQQTPRALWSQLDLGLLILHRVALQGTVNEPDLRGLDPRKHAVVVLERNRFAVVYDRVLAPCDLIAEAARDAQIRRPDLTTVYSAAASCTSSRMVAAQTPQAQAGPLIRPPAVAGAFYPADSGELSLLVDRCLGESPAEKITATAALIPHAGLVYSGRIAGDVLKRLEFPPLIIVIGPKHTAHGVEWAVAPHQTWSIPGGSVASDQALARALCEAIPGLELDAAAHAREHAIEVELPLLHRLAPQSKVVGIVLGQADWPQCQKFARGLAEVIGKLPQPPLLLISSDMHHFASDAENRRLDEAALTALETLNPRHLLEVVQEQEISMCGVIPAVIVLETLRQLGTLHKAQHISYATSGEVTGDKTRVVGYAGMLLH